MDKKCKFCNEIKPIELFSIKRGKPSSKCKECHSKYYKEYWARPGTKEKHMQRINDNRWKYRYSHLGLSAEDVKRLFEKANWQCQICHKKTSLCVDHDHITGKVRGILCTSCNTGLGRFNDNIDGLQKAIDYLTAPISSVL